MIAISVITPFYNSEKYLRETLENITSQTLKNIEIICVDDGSSDGSAEIVYDFAKKDSRFIYVKQDNSGAGSARNNGIKYASGEYIAFMDSDDEYPRPDALELLYNKAKEHNAEICGGSMWEESGIVSSRCFTRERFYSFQDNQCDFWFSRFIYKREFLIKNNCFFPESRYYEDPVFLLTVMDTAQRFYAVCEPVYKQKESHSSNRVLSLVQLKDYARGIIHNLNVSAGRYQDVFIDNIRILQGHFQINVVKCITERRADKELFSLLLEINYICNYKNKDIIDKKFLKEECFYPIELMWIASERYYKFTNYKIIKLAIKIKRALGRLKSKFLRTNKKH